MSWHAADNCPWPDIVDYNAICSDNTVASNHNARPNEHSRTDPHIITYDDIAQPIPALLAHILIGDIGVGVDSRTVTYGTPSPNSDYAILEREDRRVIPNVGIRPCDNSTVSVKQNIFSPKCERWANLIGLSIDAVAIPVVVTLKKSEHAIRKKINKPGHTLPSDWLKAR
jgi:hypothetical protein